MDESGDTDRRVPERPVAPTGKGFWRALSTKYGEQ